MMPKPNRGALTTPAHQTMEIRAQIMVELLGQHADQDEGDDHDDAEPNHRGGIDLHVRVGSADLS